MVLILFNVKFILVKVDIFIPFKQKNTNYINNAKRTLLQEMALAPCDPLT